MNFLQLFIVSLLLLVSGRSWANDDRTNVLLITADDLGYEAIGSLTLDADLPNLTPNLDRFAKQCYQFRNAHINTPICQPGRAILATGKYAVISGMMGFFHMKKRSATVMQTLSDQGFLTGILGKVPHSTPDLGYQWDYTRGVGELWTGRSP